MTDNAWTGAAFRTNEGSVQMTVPSAGMAAGSIFGYGDDFEESWQTVDGGFSLSAAGDNIFVYCQDEETSELVHMTGISLSGEWMGAGLSESTYGTASSSLPTSLADSGAAVTLSHADNYEYVGSTSGSASALRRSIATSSNWQSSNSAVYSFSHTFAVSLDPSSASSISVSDLLMMLLPFIYLVQVS
jgi:hypothetical protein